MASLTSTSQQPKHVTLLIALGTPQSAVRPRAKGKRCRQFKTDQPFDEEVLRSALEQLAANHDALRTRIDDTKPRQWVTRDCTAPLTVCELDTDEDPDAAFERYLEQMFRDPMPFGDAPLWRVDLVKIGALSFVGLSFHHIIVDTVAVQIALGQLLQIYLSMLGNQPQTAHPTSAMAPLLQQDEEYNASKQFQTDLTYWTERYDTIPPRLLPADKTPTNDPFASIVFHDIPESSGFTEAAEQAKLLPHRALFGLFAVTLARRFCRTDLSFGLALHRRDKSSLQSVAMIAGLIPVRITFEDWWSLEDCVAALDEQLDDDLKHNRLPLDALYREIGQSSLQDSPLFDVTMSYVPGFGGFPLPPGSSSSLVETREASPISFHITNDPKSGTFSYRIAVNPDYRNIIDPTALSDTFNAAVELFAAGEWSDFKDIPRLTDAEQTQLLSLKSSELGASVLVPVRIAEGGVGAWSGRGAELWRAWSCGRAARAASGGARDWPGPVCGADGRSQYRRRGSGVDHRHAGAVGSWRMPCPAERRRP